MPRISRALIFFLLFALSRVLASAATSWENARRARALLGQEVWSQVIAVENSARRGIYPRTVYALVFEFGGILWFYTDANGTQSFSLHLNRLAEERADFAPLLRDIEPGFVRYTFVNDSPIAGKTGQRAQLPNGCFIESVAALRERVASGETILRARLLSFQGTMRGGRVSHTVLSYETLSGAFVLDPMVSNQPLRFGARLSDDPRKAAQALRNDVSIERARWVPASVPASAPILASAGVACAKKPAGGNNS